MSRIGCSALFVLAALSSARAAPLEPDDLGLATVVAVRGAVSPAVKPFTTLDAPAAFDLAETARVSVVHLRSCEKIEVEGGRLNVGFNGLTASGKVTKREMTACPGAEAVQTNGVAGGVLMRSAQIGQPTKKRVGIEIAGGTTLPRGGFIALTVTSPADGLLYIYDQDATGALVAIHTPAKSSAGRLATVAAGARIAVPQPGSSVRLQVGNEPTEGRIIAVVAPEERGGCGYADVLDDAAAKPTNLTRLVSALRTRAGGTAKCPRDPGSVITGELAYRISP